MAVVYSFRVSAHQLQHTRLMLVTFSGEAL